MFLLFLVVKELSFFNILLTALSTMAMLVRNINTCFYHSFVLHNDYATMNYAIMNYAIQ